MIPYGVLVILDGLGAFALWYWVGIRGEFHDHIEQGPPWLIAYAKEPRRAWIMVAPVGLVALMVLLLWLGP